MHLSLTIRLLLVCGVWCGMLMSGGADPVQSATKSTISALATGDGNHTCAVVSGQVWCWGADTWGQLGDQGDTSAKIGAVPLRTASGGTLLAVKALSSGTGHSCAIASGQVYCWGYNSSGQLGNNDATHTDSNVAVAVLKAADVPLKGAKSVATGFAHSCAVVGSNAYCWGNGASKQLGNQTTDSSDTAVVVQGADGKPFKGVTAVAVGEDHSCALVKKQVWCWGGNVNGETGSNDMGSVNYHATPVLVRKADDTPLENVTAIAAAFHSSCAVASGTVWCWGDNTSGQLGNNDATHTTQGAAVLAKKADDTNLTEVTSVALSRQHACAVVSSAAELWCWGENGSGQLGNNSTVDQDGAVAVVQSDLWPFIGVTSVKAGYAHTCALKGLTAWCWGENGFGQLGNNDATGTDQDTPVEVRKLVPESVTGASQVSSGETHACAVQSAAVLCWGRNAAGQLGNNDMPNDTDAPVWVVTDEFDNPRLAKVKSVSAGSEHTCAVANAEAWCWGENGSGQLGNRDKPNDQDVAVRVVKSTGDPFAQVTGVAASDTHSCAISAGSAWCWGKNDYGQLGNNDGTLAEQTGAVQVVKSDATPLKGVSALAIGYYHTCAIASGGVWCWGDNEYGQLGNGDAQIGINQIVAVEVLKADGTPLKGVKSIDAGIQQTCALASAQVWCWGKNDYGQLGNPDVVARTAIPTLVEKTGDVALTNVTAIGVSDEHGCAVSLAQAWCWGRNNHDQLGNNDALHANQSRAVLVLNADTTAFTSVTMLAAGKRHTCAQANKQLWCWGSNDYGQLGNGDAPTDQNGAVLVRYAYSLLR